MTILDPTPTGPKGRSAIARPRGLALVAGIVTATGMLSAWPSTGVAADVVVELNQTCAVTGGCISGDSPGYPITISTAGRYRLTSNLTIPSAATHGISIAASHVDLDLNGFSVLGPVVCSGAPLVCSPNVGGGRGILSTTGRVGIRVRNGTVRGAGSTGIELGAESTVEDVRVRWSLGSGIVVGENSRISDCLVAQNESDGIIVSKGGVVRECVASRNGEIGIRLWDALAEDSGSVIASSTIYQNELAGFFTTSVGISLAGATVTGNAVYDNGAGILLNQGGSVVSGNVIVSNTNTGLLAGASSLTDNTIAGNGVEVDASSGNFLGGNSCDGTTTCP